MTAYKGAIKHPIMDDPTRLTELNNVTDAASMRRWLERVINTEFHREHASTKYARETRSPLREGDTVLMARINHCLFMIDVKRIR